MYPPLRVIEPDLLRRALGLFSVALNTLADVIVVVMASAARNRFATRPCLVQRLRQGSGIFLAGMGFSLALARRPTAG